jgi:hypothetical protein
MKLTFAATFIAALLPVCADAANVTAYGNDKPFEIPVGDNLIDGPHTLNCKNVNGCLLTLTVYAGTDGGGFSTKTCVFVDGHDPVPKCDTDSADPLVKHAFIKVGQGTHSMEMHMIQTTGSVQVYWWEAEYALYGK